LIKGTFGKRQGLEIFSDMGPFCHVIELWIHCCAPQTKTGWAV
jgi:hypothetical protein